MSKFILMKFNYHYSTYQLINLLFMFFAIYSIIYLVNNHQIFPKSLLFNLSDYCFNIFSKNL
jgi:hypothetical protein